MNQYLRVIPRDFFNEAKLLKCLGRLSLCILDNRQGVYNYLIEDYDNEPFDIRQTEDGDIFVLNYILKFKRSDEQILLYSYLNSKENYPLYFVNEETFDREYVFNDDGHFTKEFLNYVKGV